MLTFIRFRWFTLTVLSTLITKTTYALNHPEKQQRPYLFDIKIKKIEFFKKQGDEFIAENKIGEVTFQ